MMNLVPTLPLVVGIELLGAAILCAWRMNSTRLDPPPIDAYTDAITAADLRALPDSFLFDGPQKWRVLGETNLRLGFLHQATACLSRAAENDPNATDVALLHGYCLNRLGRLDAAQAEFQRAAFFGEGLVRETAWYFLGRTFLQAEQPDDAEKAFLSAGDAHLPSIFQRAKLLVRAGRPDEAAPLLQTLVEKLPGEVRVWQLMARFAEAKGLPDSVADAADGAERAQSLLPLHQLPPSLFITTEETGMARAFNQAVQLQIAGHARSAAHAMLPLTHDDARWQNSNPWLLQTVAAVHLEVGDADTARQLLNRQLDQEDFPTPRAWNLLGHAAFIEHDDDNADQCWQRSRFMRPADIDYGKLSVIAEHRSDADAARTYQALARLYAGIAAFRSNNLDQARSDLRAATTIAPDLAAAWFYLGEVERLLGNTAAAEQAYRECVALDPGHGRARAQLDRLASAAH